LTIPQYHYSPVIATNYIHGKTKYNSILFPPKNEVLSECTNRKRAKGNIYHALK
jgi:hypothetical protein